MFWRRKPRDESDAVDEAPVSDAEIEAQLEAELAASDAATIEAAVAGTAVEPDLLGAPRPWEVDAEAGPEEEPEPIVDGDLSAGVARSRGGFISRLRGILGLGDADAATWEEVEETLISGDVGATLAIEVVERARVRRHPDGPEAAVSDELAGLLAPRAGGPTEPLPAG